MWPFLRQVFIVYGQFHLTREERKRKRRRSLNLTHRLFCSSEQKKRNWTEEEEEVEVKDKEEEVVVVSVPLLLRCVSSILPSSQSATSVAPQRNQIVFSCLVF